MKKFLTYAILLAMFAASATLRAQSRQEEYLGLPGDNLNLYAVMKLFQESATLENFERDLNDQNFRINNLDLNGDNMIDYITVRDYADRDVHTIVLQDAINKRETQDVAVFTVQRFQNGQVQIQLIGDEALYGKNYIIEPIPDDQYASQTPNPGYTGNSAWNGNVVTTTYYEPSTWPLVRFIYTPGYIGWHSSWYWGYYPTYWHPWRPYYWDYYYGYHYNMYHNYYSQYRHWNEPRYAHWNDNYYSHRRSYSPYVSERIKEGHYRTTYSHPEQRSKGEALYARTNHEQNNRRSEPAQVNSAARRNDSRSTLNPGSKEAANSARRSTGTSGVNTAKRSTNENNSFSERRAATATGTPSARSASKPAANTRNVSNRRSDATSTPAATTRASSTNRSSGTSTPAATTRASSANRSSGTSKPAATTRASSANRSGVTSKPAATTRASSANRSNGSSKPAAAAKTSSGRRSSEASKPAKTTTKSSENKKSGETTKATRR